MKKKDIIIINSNEDRNLKLIQRLKLEQNKHEERLKRLEELNEIMEKRLFKAGIFSGIKSTWQRFKRR